MLNESHKTEALTIIGKMLNAFNVVHSVDFQAAVFHIPKPESIQIDQLQ